MPLKLNKHERARIEQIRAWARAELRKELDLQLRDPDLYEALQQLLAKHPIPGAELDIFAGARRVTWLLKILDREDGRAVTVKSMLAAVKKEPAL